MTATADRVQGLEANAGFFPGRSVAIQSVNAIVANIAGSDVPVLLVGESGTGKEVYARLIHGLSRHGYKPLVKFHCRTMERGEFLAQLKARSMRRPEDSVGRGQAVFLDEIDELDATCQKALLSVLPDGEYEKKDQEPMRLIASTARKLEKEVEEGRFRKELFFRINGVCLRLPPLRERKDDIAVLLQYFLERHTPEIRREIVALGKEELELIESYDWPGNIRELENFARKISLFGRVREALQELQRFERASVPPHESSPTSLKAAARAASRQAERELIQEALERTHWNRKRAAQQLNISYKSLLYKIKQTGLAG